MLPAGVSLLGWEQAVKSWWDYSTIPAAIRRCFGAFFLQVLEFLTVYEYRVDVCSKNGGSEISEGYLSESLLGRIPPDRQKRLSRHSRRIGH